jgi:MFS family permease
MPLFRVIRQWYGINVDLAKIWMIWVAALLLGCVNAIDNPARQAFTVDLVSTNDVTNAVGLNNAIGPASRAVGPAIGAFLLSATGIAPCFLINAMSYFIVVVALRAMRPCQLHIESRVQRRPGQLREGLRHVWHHPVLRTTIAIVMVVSSFGYNFQVLLPLLAKHAFHGNGALYGLMMSSLGLGAVIGAFIAACAGAPSLTRISILSILFGLANVAIGLSHHLLMALLAVGATGVFSSMFLASCSGCL